MPNSTVNLASRYSAKVDERFAIASQAALALNQDYRFAGVRTVNVYSIPTVPLNNYTRSGQSRYGTPADLENSVQELTVTRDRAFSFVIDRADRNQTQMTMDAGRALSRQIREVVVPEYDAYIFRTMALTASVKGNTASTAATKNNAYELFLNAQEALGNHDVPDMGRVCFCSYRFANLLKQDPAFMRYGEMSQFMLAKGVMGEVDGTRIVKVAASRLPTGAEFILTHPVAACAPKQLEDYKIHDNPPGISGWLVEGRILYDCFILKEKAHAVWYHGTAVSNG
ncbi:MAG: N4-gp56 family major capsid protein [Oscillospiraceae bacterium]|nr:N4-gp56 family major capsid protein [Oscillospiraceae bacterium]